MPDLRSPMVVGVTPMLELQANDGGDRRMGLADELAALPKPARLLDAPPLMDRIIATFDGDDRAALLRCLGDPALATAQDIADVLAKYGHTISVSSIRSWRRRHAAR